MHSPYSLNIGLQSSFRCTACRRCSSSNRSNTNTCRSRSTYCWPLRHCNRSRPHMCRWFDVEHTSRWLIDWSWRTQSDIGTFQCCRCCLRRQTDTDPKQGIDHRGDEVHMMFRPVSRCSCTDIDSHVSSRCINCCWKRPCNLSEEYTDCPEHLKYKIHISYHQCWNPRVWWNACLVNRNSCFIDLIQSDRHRLHVTFFSLNRADRCFL